MLRILTEDKNRKLIVSLVSLYFEGFTIIPSIGFWKGEREKALTIEIATDNPKEDYKKAKKIAEIIKLFNEQETVLVQYIDNVKSEFI